MFFGFFQWKTRGAPLFLVTLFPSSSREGEGAQVSVSLLGRFRFCGLRLVFGPGRLEGRCIVEICCLLCNSFGLDTSFSDLPLLELFLLGVRPGNPRTRSIGQAHTLSRLITSLKNGG